MSEFLDFALSLAGAAERAILPVYRNCAIDFKSDGSEVTEADRRAEQVMREMILERYPDHDILGEEFGGSSKAAHQWILDPIDGTTAFVAGVPVFGTLIAYAEQGEPLLGVINFPALGETVYAAKGAGCWFRAGNEEPRRLKAARPVDLAGAFVSTTGLHATNIHPTIGHPSYNLGALIPKARRFRFFGDCMQHALVCQGRIDAAIDTIMNPWDIAALVPCVEEAGGVVTNLDGNRKDVVAGPGLLTSSSPALHSEILSILRS